MINPRKLIRQAFVGRLKTPLEGGGYRTAAQGRIYDSRLTPISEEELQEDGPAILVYSRMEKYHADKDYGPEGHATTLCRELHLVTEAMVTGGSKVDDVLDDIAQEMEEALSDFDIPGFESARIRLTQSDIDVITEQVKRPIGAIGLVWEIIYRTTWRPRSSIDNIDQSIADFLAGGSTSPSTDGIMNFSQSYQSGLVVPLIGET